MKCVQTGVGVPDVDDRHASPRNGREYRWASIATPMTRLHVSQTHMQYRGTELHCCVRASSKSRALDGASTKVFESRLLVVNDTHYLDRSIICIFIYSECKSQCFYCDLGHMRCFDVVPQIDIAPASIHITKATSAEGLIISFDYIGREI